MKVTKQGVILTIAGVGGVAVLLWVSRGQGGGDGPAALIPVPYGGGGGGGGTYSPGPAAPTETPAPAPAPASAQPDALPNNTPQQVQSVGVKLMEQINGIRRNLPSLPRPILTVEPPGFVTPPPVATMPSVDKPNILHNLQPSLVGHILDGADDADLGDSIKVPDYADGGGVTQIDRDYGFDAPAPIKPPVLPAPTTPAPFIKLPKVGK